MAQKARSSGLQHQGRTRLWVPRLWKGKVGVTYVPSELDIRSRLSIGRVHTTQKTIECR